MSVLCATAENSALLKKDKSTAVKLKASDYVGLPKYGIVLYYIISTNCSAKYAYRLWLRQDAAQ